MIRFKALTTGDSDDSSQGTPDQKCCTKEAEEAEAFSLYNQALLLMKEGQLEQAKDVFHELLDYTLLQAAAPLTSGDEGLVHPGLVIKYSVYQNLAKIASQDQDKKQALEYYLQAVLVDWTDVTVWYKIGTLAVSLNNISLARHAFQQGLDCNPDHWPCLENIILVLYALNNYPVCLNYIAQALERDSCYLAGKAFLHKIFSEQPSLRHQSRELFRKCSDTIYESDSDSELMDEFVEDALLLRHKKQELVTKVPPLTTIKPNPASTATTTWKSLGETLLCLYERIESERNRHTKYESHHCRPSFAQRVDLMAPMSQSMKDVASSEQPGVPNIEITLAEMSQSQSETEKLFNSEMDVQMEVDHDPHHDPHHDLQMEHAPSNEHCTEERPSDAASGNMEVLGHSIGAKRGRKRKFHPLGEDYTGKRRSARVRNTVSKKDEAVDYHELLSKFLPLSLLEVQDIEDDSCSVPSTMEISTAPGTLDSLLNTAQSINVGEQAAVKEFLQKHQNNGGILDLLIAYLVSLANKALTSWCFGLTHLYMEAYKKLRKHFEYPDYLCKDSSDETIRDMSLMCLVYFELQLDQWSSKAKTTVLQDGSPHRAPGDSMALRHALGDNFPEQFTSEDLAYLTGLTVFSDLLSEKWAEYSSRVYWVQARYLVLQGDMEWAVDSFHRTEEYLKILLKTKQEDGTRGINLPNCKHDNTITELRIEKQLDSLARCQSLDIVHKLYNAGSYDRVVDLLLQTFTREQESEASSIERHSQLLLLQDSLLHLKDYKKCVIWSEVSLNEALTRYFSATSLCKHNWLTTLIQLMEGLDKCFTPSHQLQLPSKCLVRLTHNLVRLIQKAMDAPLSAVQMSIPTMLPWILLYRLVRNEEMCLGGLEVMVEGDTIPCSLALINIAHDYLGRRSWCTQCDGQLLLFMVDVLMAEMATFTADKPVSHEEDLKTAVEQCFYCLYNHPSKRTKAKHLDDHNTEGVPLQWEHAVQVFQYFKPTSMPEYDSYKTSTVSAELESFLRRISVLVPQSDSSVITVDSVTAYVEGASSKIPAFSPGYEVTLPMVQQLFYLLADYYFKNKETMKAIKFYMHDLCYNPSRFDSWAGMALARASRLEQKLASHELRPDVSIQRQAICTLRCFKRALQVDPSNGKLWIEYGSMAYQLHSFASRQLKQKHWYRYTADQLELATINKKDMLELSYSCYTKAAAQDEGEEQWLHHYMLGKIAEKQHQSLHVYLDHYKLAAQYLHDDQAKYPRKITFYHSAPHLAIEALEMHYRLHVSILKYLLHNKNKPDIPLGLLKGYIMDAAEGPFANCKELMRADGHYHDEERSSSAQAQMMSADDEQKTMHESMPDHTYSKEKQTSESELSSQESDLLNTSQDSSVNVGASSPRFEGSSARLQRSNRFEGSSAGHEGSSPSRVDQSHPVHSPSAASPAASNHAAASNHTAASNHAGDRTSQPLDSSANHVPPPTSESATPPPTSESSVPPPTSESATPPPTSESSIQPPTSESSISPPTSESATPPQMSESSIQPPTSESSIPPPTSESTTPPPTSESAIQPPTSESATPPPTSESAIQPPTSESAMPPQMSESSLTTNYLTSPVIENMDFDTPVCDVAHQGTSVTTMPTLQKIPNLSINAQPHVSSPHTAFTVESILKQPTPSPSAKMSNKQLDRQESMAESYVDKVASISSSPHCPAVIDLSPAAGFVSYQAPTSPLSSPDQSPPTLVSHDSQLEDISQSGSCYWTDEAMDMEPPVLDEPYRNESPHHGASAEVTVSSSYVTQVQNTIDEKSDDDIDLLYVDGATDEKPCEKGATHIPTQISTARVQTINVPTTGAQTTNVPTTGAQTTNVPTTCAQTTSVPTTSVQTTNVPTTGAQTTHVPLARKQTTHLPAADVQDNNMPIADSQDIEVPTTPTVEAVDCPESTSSITEDSKESKTVENKQRMSAEISAKTTERMDVSNIPIHHISQPDTNMQIKAGTVTKDEKSDEPMEISSVKIENESQNVSKATKMKLYHDSNASTLMMNAENVDGSKIDNIPPKKSSAMECTNGEEQNAEERYRQLIEACMKALCLCLQRLPQHHKSLYRLAYVYMYCPQLKGATDAYFWVYLGMAEYKLRPNFKAEILRKPSTYTQNIEYAQDLLAGNPNWASLSHMPCPGMFQDRKQNNFFQGLWKIPIEEIDRSGSFAMHLTASISLMFRVLEEREQSKTLYHIHLQLSRTPDTGRKYIRDCDRTYLADDAYKRCLKGLETKVAKQKASADKNKPGCLMEVYKIWQYGIKQRMQTQKLNKLLLAAYRRSMSIKIESDAAVLEQAIKYCQLLQQKQQASKAVKAEESRREHKDSIGIGHDTVGRQSTDRGYAQSEVSSSSKARISSPCSAQKLDMSESQPAGDTLKQEMLVKYQQEQMEMLAALTQLYGQSAYSMAYASSLQAMGTGMYEGYNPYAMAGVGQLSPTMAHSLLQNTALAASMGYPYAGYGMTAEALATLSQALAAGSTPSDVNLTSPTSHSHGSSFQSSSSLGSDKSSRQSSKHGQSRASAQKCGSSASAKRSSPLQSVSSRHEGEIPPQGTKYSPETMKSTTHPVKPPFSNISPQRPVDCGQPSTGAYGGSSVRSSYAKPDNKKLLQVQPPKITDPVLPESTSEYFSTPKTASLYGNPAGQAPSQSLLSPGVSYPASSPDDKVKGVSKMYPSSVMSQVGKHSTTATSRYTSNKAGPSRYSKPGPSRYHSKTASSSKYPGNTASSSKYPGNTASSTKYPGNTASSSKYPGNTASSSKYLGNTASSSKYPGNTASSSKYPGNTASSSKYPGNTASSSKYPGNTASSSKYPGNTASSSKYPGNTASSSKYPGNTASSSKYPENTASSSKYPGNTASSSKYSPTGTNPSRYSPSTSSPSRSTCTTTSPSRSTCTTTSPSRSTCTTTSPTRSTCTTTSPSRSTCTTTTPTRSTCTTTSPSRSTCTTSSPSRYSTYTTSPSQYGSQLSPVRYSGTTVSSAYYSLSSESQDIVVISSSQESDED